MLMLSQHSIKMSGHGSNITQVSREDGITGSGMWGFVPLNNVRYSHLMTCCNPLFVIPRSQSLTASLWSPAECLDQSQVRMSKEREEGLLHNKAHFCGQQTFNANVKTRLKLEVFAGECQSIRQSDLQFPCHL